MSHSKIQGAAWLIRLKGFHPLRPNFGFYSFDKVVLLVLECYKCLRILFLFSPLKCMRIMPIKLYLWNMFSTWKFFYNLFVLFFKERLQHERQEALENMGISVQSSGIMVEKSKYYLVNLNADPSLNEMLVYYLKDRTLVGSKKGDIILSGFSIDISDEATWKICAWLHDHQCNLVFCRSWYPRRTLYHYNWRRWIVYGATVKC